MKTLKKTLAVFLVIIMLLSSAPLQGFGRIDLPWFSSKAHAIGSYSVDAAVNWAKNHWNDIDSPLLGKGYWYDGGDCANFVSQCIYMGGINMNSGWHTNGYKCHEHPSSRDSFVNAQNLYEYVCSIGGQAINNPATSQVSIGDLIFYKTTNDNRMHHSAIVTDISNGTPVVAAHSTNETRYNGREYTLGYSGSRIYLVKMYGATCYVPNPRNIYVYIATGSSSLRRCYSSADPYSNVNFTFSSGEYALVDVNSITYSNGYRMGKTSGYGKNGWFEGWIKIDAGGFAFQSHQQSSGSSHAMGGWTVSKNPTCTSNGVKVNTCRKCGYQETQTIPKKGHSAVAATCTNVSYCSVCGSTLSGKLGHNLPSAWTTTQQPTCTGNGTQVKKCTRCGYTKTNTLSRLGHNLGEWKTVREATCIIEGIDERKCTRCTYTEVRNTPVVPHPYGAEEIITEPTCTEVGTKKRTCTHCGIKTLYNYGVALGHEYGEWYIETPATENTLAVERCDCIRGDSTLRRNVASHDHDYSEWDVLVEATCTENGYKERTCAICLFKDQQEIIATGHKVNAFEMGSYPQSRVEDETLLTELNSLIDDEKLISYNYYYGNGEVGSMQQGDYMKYADVEYKGAKYRFVDIVKARPITTYGEIEREVEFKNDIHDGKAVLHSLFSYQRYNGYLPYLIDSTFSVASLHISVYETEERYWFKFEPITWRVLDQDEGLVISDTIIDAQPYSSTVYQSLSENLYVDGEYIGEYYGDSSLETYSTEYRNSSIRKWLNDDFYNTAFTDEEKALIATSTVEDSCENEYSSATVYDKIFIPSYDEVTNLEYYFDSDAGDSASRTAVSSDYAQCQGVLNSTTADRYKLSIKSVSEVMIDVISYDILNEEMLNRWWLRTNAGSSIDVKTVNAKGNVSNENEFASEILADQGVGVRPAMRIDGLEIIREDKDPTCTEPGYIGEEYCFVCDEQISSGYEIPALGHNYLESKNIPPSCLENGIVEKTCANCGDVQIIDEPDALGHNIGDWYVVTDATCLEDGLERRDCLRGDCDYYEENVLKAKGHTEKYEEPDVEPTCTEDGYYGETYCAICSTVLKERVVRPALNHNEGTWICINEGYEEWNGVSIDECNKLRPECGYTLHFELRCTRCIADETCDALLDEYELTINEHELQESEREEPDCLQPGYIVYECIFCDYVETEILEKTEHNWSEWTTVEESSCIHPGEEESHCTNECDTVTVEYRIIAPSYTEHNYVVTEIITSECSAGTNLNHYVCDRCNETECESCINTDKPHHYWDGNPAEHNIQLNTEKSIAPACAEIGVNVYECINDGCSYGYNETVAILGHDCIVSENVEFTCTESGYDVYVCQRENCDYTYNVYLNDCPGHYYSDEFTVMEKASCTENGLKELHCSRYIKGELCNSLLDSDVIEKREHNWSEWTTIYEATCEEDGLEEKVCLNTDETDEYYACNAHKENVIPATNHDWDKWVTVTPATCEEDGLEKRTCKNDASHTEENVLPAINHKWDNGVINPESTCKLHGTKTYTCQNDNSHTYTETVELNPDNHVGETYIKDEKSASCTEDGYTGDTYCSDCDALLEKGETIPATKHDWDKWETVTPATCEGNGLEKRICKNDASHVEQNVLPAINHKWDNGVINPESTCKLHGTKTYTCQNDNSHTYTETVELNPDNHVGETYIKDEKSATCTEDGYTGDTYCSDCDALLEKGEAILATKHDWDKWVTVTPATCEGNGLEKRICKNDASHTEENVLPAINHKWDNGVINPESTCKLHGTKTYTCQNDNSHTYTETVELNPDNHVGETYIKDEKSATCTEDGYTGDTYCADCDALLEKGEAIPATKHDWGEWETVTEPTYDCVGEKKQTCKNDSTHINTEIIPVLTRPSDNNENIETEKTVDYDKLTGEALIRLLASSKGEKITTKSRIPLDIVLVLDQSGSMSPENGNLIAKLKDAVDKFTVAIHKDAIDNEIDHRIAMVGFAMQNQYNFGNEFYQYLNTEILTTGGDPIRYSSLLSDEMNKVYKNSLVYVDVDGLVNPVLTTAKNNIDAKGATAADLGLDMACKIFSQNENDGSRKRIVVFMTDGVPTYKSDYMAETAENAISKAELLKDTYDADIYSVGVLSGSGASQAKTFLRNVCSEDQDKNELYFDCTEPEELVESFEKIAEDSTEIVTDFDDITLVDTVSSAFTLTYIQEQKLRLDAIEKLGVKNEDIAVTRYDDGTTEIEIKHISPKKVENGSDINFVVDFSFNVTANENALVADSYITNTDNAGIVVGVKDVYENNFKAPSDTVEEAEGVIYFNVNGITYHVVRVHAGEKVKQPEINLEGGYTFSGWDIPDEITFDGGKFTVDSVLDRTEYTVTWFFDGKTETQTYYCGDFITPPEVGLNSTGDIFLKWNKEVPAVMPAENLAFTAVYGEHTHNYTETVQKKASCGVEGVAEFTCLCGDRYTEVIDALTHKWATRTTSSEANQTAFSSVYCVNCGDSPDENLSYTIKGKSGWSSVEYDLKLVDAENISIQPDGTITVSLPIPAEMKNARNVKIYREEADGSLTELTSTKSGSYITFTTDHFSKYIIKATYECNETGNHSDSNCDKLCDICGVEYANLGHSYTAKVTAPTCTSKGYTTYTCTKCGDSYKADETPVAQHNYKSAVTAPTCTSKGFTTYTCKACGNSYKADEKAALGHNLSAYIVVKSATCTENGSEKASCSRCTYSETRTIKATDHDYKDGICTKCGSDKSKNCSCNCHKGGISGFFFKLILFFQKIFKTNKICKCGKNHY